jgi:hypothetical protein
MKDVGTPVDQVMSKERDDHGFHVGIFEQAHAASAHLKALALAFTPSPG